MSKRVRVGVREYYSHNEVRVEVSDKLKLRTTDQVHTLTTCSSRYQHHIRLVLGVIETLYALESMW